MRNKSQTPNPFALNLPLCIEKRENDSKMCLSIIYNKDTFLLFAAEKIYTTGQISWDRKMSQTVLHIYNADDHAHLIFRMLPFFSNNK